VDLTLPFYYNNLPDNVYQISIRDDNQCELTESVDIQRLSAPSGINIALQEATCNLNNACLEVTQIQNGSAPYQYAINNGDFTFNPSFCGLAPTQVLVHVKDVNGCQTDTLVQLLAADPVSANISLVDAVKCHGGNDGVVSVEITNGQGPFQVLWSNGVSNLQNENLSAGIYSVEIKDDNNCETLLEIEVPQPAPLNATFEKTDATCELNNGIIQVSNATGGVSPYTYNISGTFQNQTLFSGLTPDTYQIVIKDQNNCEFNVGSTVINMLSFPTAINLAVEDAKCGLPNGKVILQNITGGEWPIQVQFAGNAYVYQGQSIEFNNLQEGNYQINISDMNACVLSKDTSLVNHLGPEFLETSVSPTTCNLDNGCIELGTVVGGNGTSVYSLNGSNFSLYPTYCNLASGNYLLIVKDMLGCELAIDLFVPATIPVNANADRISDVTCYGGSDGEALAMATVGTGPFNYQWSNGENTPLAQNLNAGDHTAYITDIYGCIDSSAVLIEEPLPLTIVATASEITCAGDSALLSANAYGGVGNILLHWPHNGSNSNSLIVNPLETTVYVVTATDENECVMMAQVLQEVNPLPVFNIISDVEKACTPSCVNFGLQGNQSAFVSYQWMIADSISSSNPDPKVCFETPGSVNAYVMVTDNNGCKNTQSVNNLTEIYPTPEVSFTYNPEKPTILKPIVQFNESSTHAVNWQWDFGDGFYAYEPNPEYTFADTGKFEVCLEVMSLHGCKNETCEPIYIKPVYTFYAPNAFTPNGDGNNDEFKLEGTYLTEVHLIIYNRWGEKMFESFDLDKGWDGTYQGRIVQDDVYTWIATVRTFDKTTLQEKGRVKVMR
jgi:gliding motility-associated-like protein